MRLFKLASGLAALVAALIVVAPQTAEAGGLWRDRGHVQTVGHKRCPRPQLLHRYRRGDADPYHYCYEPRGYYPYYNSRHWGPARYARKHYRLPPYYKAWGGPKRGYKHREWHNRHHGRIRRGHW